MNRKTVALGIAAVAAVAAAVVVTVANGRGASPQHDATAAYITSVDTIQQQLRVELTKATQTYRAFALGSAAAADRPKLAQAQRTIRTLERRLVALPAPAVATRLKLLLVKLAHAEVTLAGELGAVATFSPRFATLLRSVSAARVELARALGAAAPPKTHAIRGTKKQVKAARAQFAVAAAHAAALQADAL